MFREVRAAVLALVAAALPAQAGGPVVVELFTSQGCSACPPADALLAELADRPGIIALALHVDYWDYLGWADSFASPAFSKRQRSYAKAFGERMVYTPQIVVQGRVGIVGSRTEEIEAAIAAAAAEPLPVTVSLTAQEDGVAVVLDPASGPVGEASVSYMVYAEPQTVRIGRGENTGLDLTYRNVVRSWMMLGRWHGEPVRWVVPRPQDALGVAVLVQDPETRAILGAAMHRFDAAAN